MSPESDLTAADMASQEVAELPDKEAMSLLDLNVDLNLALDLAAPIDAAVAANVGSIDSQATAVAQQDAIITQNIDANAEATADQQSTITQ